MTDNKRPLVIDIATTKTSELLVLLDPSNLVTCIFGPNCEGMPEDHDAAQAEVARVQRLVIDEIDRRIPVPVPVPVPAVASDSDSDTVQRYAFVEQTDSGRMYRDVTIRRSKRTVTP